MPCSVMGVIQIVKGRTDLACAPDSTGRPELLAGARLLPEGIESETGQVADGSMPGLITHPGLLWK